MIEVWFPSNLRFEFLDFDNFSKSSLSKSGQNLVWKRWDSPWVTSCWYSLPLIWIFKAVLNKIKQVTIHGHVIILIEYDGILHTILFADIIHWRQGSKQHCLEFQHLLSILPINLCKAQRCKRKVNAQSMFFCFTTFLMWSYNIF